MVERKIKKDENVKNKKIKDPIQFFSYTAKVQQGIILLIYYLTFIINYQ